LTSARPGSFSADSAVKKSSEQTHKHSRTQSAKASSEIVRNFKTTYKVVTDSTDTTSRRYVVQNTTDKLVNYELRRKMRKVGVQVQHIGSRLSWQVFLDVTLPLSRAGIIGGCLLVFIPAVGEFTIPALLGGADTLMIGRVLWDEFFSSRDWPVASAVSVVLLLLLVVPIMWFQHLQSREQEAGA